MTKRYNVEKPKKILFWLTFFLTSICCLTLGLTPTISRDALIHHLTIPKIYLQAGRVLERPDLFFSYFPGNIDILYTFPVAFKVEFLAKYIHFSFSIFTAILIFKFVERILSKNLAYLASLLFLSTPIIIKLSITAYVDLGLIFFSWASLYYLFKWKDNLWHKKPLIMAGIFCGLALGTKYNGLLTLLILAAFVPFIYLSERKKEKFSSFHAMKFGVIFIFMSLIVFSPWMTRNYIWTENPIYPLYNSVFNPPSITEQVEKSDETDVKITPFWQRKYVYQESFLETITIPIRMFFEGQDDNPKYFDGKLTPILLFFSLLSFLKFGRGLTQKQRFFRNYLSTFSILVVSIALFKIDFRIRYISPIIPALTILSVLGISNTINLSKSSSTQKQTFIVALISCFVLYGLLYNAHYIYTQFQYVKPLQYITTNQDKDSYISNYRHEHPTVLYANKNLDQDSIILCLSIGDRTYYINNKIRLINGFYKLAKKPDFSANMLNNRIADTGATHIIIDKSVFMRWLKTQPRRVQKIFSNYFNNETTTIYQENNVLLLYITNSI